MIVAGEEELGEQKWCPRCREWWPRDDGFFRRETDGRWYGWCRACTYEYRGERRRMERIAERVA